MYSAIIFLAAVIFLWTGVSIYKGNTNLINSYHQENVKDKKAYGKAFGKAMLFIAVSMLLSGIIDFFAKNLLAIAVLLVGLIVGIIGIILVQLKYNKKGDLL